MSVIAPPTTPFPVIPRPAPPPPTVVVNNDTSPRQRRGRRRGGRRGFGYGYGFPFSRRQLVQPAVHNVTVQDDDDDVGKFIEKYWWAFALLLAALVYAVVKK